ncbi:hypothetical protein AAMO2058_001411300 [Amorphochlora amoebiformis]
MVSFETQEELLKFIQGLSSVGIIQKEGDYSYLLAKLRRFMELSNVDSKSLSFHFYKPLSPVGLHISLEEARKDEIGTQVEFKVNSVILQRANIGVASRHDPRYYHCQWFALEVELMRPTHTPGPPFAKGRAHVSVACYGIKLDPTNSTDSKENGKKGKKKGGKKKKRKP